MKRERLDQLRRNREKSNHSLRNQTISNDDLIVHKTTSPETIKSLLQVRLTANEKKNEAMRKRGL